MILKFSTFLSNNFWENIHLIYCKLLRGRGMGVYEFGVTSPHGGITFRGDMWRQGEERGQKVEIWGDVIYGCSLRYPPPPLLPLTQYISCLLWENLITCLFQSTMALVVDIKPTPYWRFIKCIRHIWSLNSSTVTHTRIAAKSIISRFHCIF